MKKYYFLLVVVIALLLIIIAAFLWSNQQLSPQSGHVYHKGDQIPNTVFTFDGFTYRSPPVFTPPYGSSPPPYDPTPLLCVVFKLNSAGVSANQASGIHISYPTEDVISLSTKGNTTTDLGDSLDNQFYTIVAYNEVAQTITMVYDAPID
jgi:hypothetical protein